MSLRLFSHSYAVPTSFRYRQRLAAHLTRLWHRTLRRRSQQDRQNWDQMDQLIATYLAKADDTTHLAEPTTDRQFDPSPMPNASVAAAQDRRGGDLQHRNGRGPALGLVPRPSRVPTARAAAHRRIVRTAPAHRPRTDPGIDPEERPTPSHAQAARTVFHLPRRPAQNASGDHPCSTYRRKPTCKTPKTIQKSKTDASMNYAGCSSCLGRASHGAAR